MKKFNVSYYMYVYYKSRAAIQLYHLEYPKLYNLGILVIVIVMIVLEFSIITFCYQRN